MFDHDSMEESYTEIQISEVGAMVLMTVVITASVTSAIWWVML